MSKAHYPQPREDADNTAFLSAWREGRLLIQCCESCGRAIFYPRPMCPHCWSDTISSRPADGRGTVVSYSLVHRPNDAAFDNEVPIILAEVELVEGASLIARIVDCDASEVRSGRAVAVLPAGVCARYPLPVFHLA